MIADHDRMIGRWYEARPRDDAAKRRDLIEGEIIRQLLGKKAHEIPNLIHPPSVEHRRFGAGPSDIVERQTALGEVVGGQFTRCTRRDDATSGEPEVDAGVGRYA